MLLLENRWFWRFNAGLLMTTALAPSIAIVPAQAKTGPVPAIAQMAPRIFDIPSQSLATGLVTFRRQAGVMVAPYAGFLGNRSTTGVHGRMLPIEALRQLLAGTDFTSSVSDTGVYVLHGPAPQMAAAPALSRIPTVPVFVTTDTAVADPAPDTAVLLPTVRVQSQMIAPYIDPAAPYKADRLSSSRFTEPVLNTPRTVTILTREAIDDKNATTLREIARSTAGVTLGSGEGGNAFGDRFFIRGFDARNDIFVGGVRDPGVSIRETFNVEQVEILRGPASSFAGRGTAGGAINIVNKEARFADFYHGEAEGGFSDATKRATVDVNRIVNDKVAVRLNAMGQGADVAGRDYTTDNRWGVAAAVTVTPTDDITLKGGYSHTYLWGLPDFGVPYNQVARAPVTETGVSRNTYYGIVNRDFTRTTQDVGTLDAEWRVNDWLTIGNKFRAGYSILDYIGTIPENPSATGATARFSSTPNFFSGYTQLNAQSRYQTVGVTADQPEATFKFNTGAITHTAVVGGEFSNERVGIDTYTGLTSELTTGPVAFASSGAPIVNVYSPTNYLLNPATPRLNGNPLRYNVNTNAGYAFDTANYRDIVLVNGGIRYDDYDITAKNNTSSRSTTSGLASYNAGLVIKPIPSVSVYGAFATASTPVGSELDATSSTYGGFSATQNTSQLFGPQKAKAYEAGVKWELFDRHLLATAAAFQTDVSNARETAPANLPGYTSGQIVSGAQYRVRGVDFELAGKITDKWSLLGGFVVLDTEVQKSVARTNVGLQLANIAPRSFNLLTKYHLTDWLELGGQAVYVSEIRGGSLLAANGNVAYPNAPSPTLLPAHWRFDLFAETKITPSISAKLFAQNILDKTYYDALYQSAQPFIQVAPGRSVYLSLAAKF